jgi:hypothetical protein
VCWPPFVLVVEMLAMCLRMMLPTAPASPGVGVREDDGHGVSSEARSFYPLFACVSVSCSLCLLCMHPVSAGFAALLI